MKAILNSDDDLIQPPTTKKFKLTRKKKSLQIDWLDSSSDDDYDHLKATFNLPDEMITIILSYLPKHQILRKCILISKQWLAASGNLNLCLRTNCWSSCGPVTLKKRLNMSFAKCFTGLEIEGRKSLKDKIALIGESQLTRLEYLTLKKCAVNNQNLEKLLATTNISNLKLLNLYYNSLKSDSTISGFANLPKLESLNLAKNCFSTETIRIIVDNCPKLRYLTLSESGLTSDQFQIIAENENMSNLVWLAIGSTNVSAIGATYLANSPYINNLTNLDIYCCTIGANGVKELCESGKLKKLTSLDMNGNDIGVEGAQYIANCQDLSNLTSLDIGYNEILDSFEGAVEIFESPYLSKLKDLDISKNKIGFDSKKEAFNAMIECKWLNNILDLSLADNTISYYGKTLFEKWNLSNIECLNLDNTRIKRDGVKIITESEKYSNLTELNIDRNTVLKDSTASDLVPQKHLPISDVSNYTEPRFQKKELNVSRKTLLFPRVCIFVYHYQRKLLADHYH